MSENTAIDCNEKLRLCIERQMGLQGNVTYKNAENICKTMIPTNNKCTYNGGKKPSTMKRTSEKVKVGNAERCVYIGTRGGKYVKVSGKFVPLKQAKKSKK
jgi:hypothetical protein